MKKLAASGTAIVLITHDRELISACADRVVYIEKGKVGYTSSVRQNAE